MSKNKACFSRDVCCSDRFAELSFEAQALYLRLGFEVDGLGALDATRTVAASIGAPPEALDELRGAGYLLDASDGVDSATFVAHHLVNNKIDRANMGKSGHGRLAATELRLADRALRVYVPAERGGAGLWELGLTDDYGQAADDGGSRAESRPNPDWEQSLNKKKQKETKPTEGNGNQTNGKGLSRGLGGEGGKGGGNQPGSGAETGSVPGCAERETGSVPERRPPASVPCPECHRAVAVSVDGPPFRAHCQACGFSFRITADGEIAGCRG